MVVRSIIQAPKLPAPSTKILFVPIPGLPVAERAGLGLPHALRG